MKSLARLVLFIVLAVSLPFHSAYGVGMAQCMAFAKVGAAPERQAASPDHRAALAGHDRHHADNHDGAGHGHHADAETPDHAGAADGSPHCGTCTACSTAVGMPVISPTIPCHEGYAAMVSPPEHPLSSIPPSRLDRPPLAL